MSEIKIIGSVYDPIRVTATVAAAVVGAPGMVWRGTYNAERYYYENEVVYWNGSSWIANRYVDEGLVPGVSASWSLVAQSGTSVPWADPEVYVPGNLLQVNAGSDGFEDSGVPAADVVKNTGSDYDYGAIAFCGGISGKEIEFENSKPILSLITIESGSSGNANELPVFNGAFGDGEATPIISSGKTIDQVKTELGYLYIPASAFEARKTNGATWAVEESATNDQVKGIWLFDAATPEAIQIIIPNIGDGLGLITAGFKFKIHAKLPVIGTGSLTDNSVAWIVKAVIEGAEPDQSWGTAVQVNQEFSPAKIEISDWSALITAAGTIENNCRMIIEVSRNASDTEYDLLAQDVAFLGLELQMNLSA